MGAYSLDIRRKVVAAYQLGNTSIRQLAKRFTMSTTTVQKLLRQYRETQDLTPQKTGTKKVSKLEAHRDFLLDMVASYPDWTLIQYAEYLHNQRGVEASPSILCRFFQREQITLKKRPIGTRVWSQRKSKTSASISGKR